ncbi:nitroreductase family protein [Pontibacter sp. KCTC 32443]|uniref:nitroreductase family protein n=1 Tax=Pontibacter TaxID=323449 RepID=UPI00164D8171|nr:MULTISPECIES: nitroreductase family protein [Pontibacter]MBC5775121.1 nitroreductase family protein [Pontibacter sp. KCTC 32443]
MIETENKIEVHNLIQDRWSPRAFDSKPVEDEKLEAIFEAARWAPSAMNEQPWRFVFATKNNPEAYEKLLSCLVEANQLWAKNAPVLILSVAKANYSNNGNRNAYAWHDTGMATANLALQATELGLHLHIMGGFSADKAREVLGIPEGYEPVSMMAIGYLGDPSQLPDHLKAREVAPRNRKPLQELVFNGIWK